MKRITLESVHALHSRRPEFLGATETREDDYIQTTAQCGCVNRTRIINGNVTGDGVTIACEKHADYSEDDYSDEGEGDG